jgi:hypothetical protein
MTRPTSLAVLAALASSLNTALGVTVVAANPIFALPNVTPPAAAIGFVDVTDPDSPTMGSAQKDTGWRLTYYGANERQLVDAKDAIEAWARDHRSLAVTGYDAVEVMLTSLARRTPTTESTLEHYALDAVLTTTY